MMSWETLTYWTGVLVVILGYFFGISALQLLGVVLALMVIIEENRQR